MKEFAGVKDMEMLIMAVVCFLWIIAIATTRRR